MIENEDGKTAYHLAVENKALLAQAVIENFIMNVISWARNFISKPMNKK